MQLVAKQGLLIKFAEPGDRLSVSVLRHCFCEHVIPCAPLSLFQKMSQKILMCTFLRQVSTFAAPCGQVQLCEAAASGETAQLELLVDVIGVQWQQGVPRVLCGSNLTLNPKFRV